MLGSIGKSSIFFNGNSPSTCICGAWNVSNKETYVLGSRISEHLRR